MLATSFVCFLSKSQLSLAELVCAADSDFVLLWIIGADVLRLLCAMCYFRLLQGSPGLLLQGGVIHCL